MKMKLPKLILYSIVFIFSIFCLLPFIMVISGSLSNEQDIYKYGYTILPVHIDFISYRLLFMNAVIVLSGYKISIIVTFFGTIISLLVNTMAANAIARKELKYRKILATFFLITLLFNGGMVSWYMICTGLLHLKDNILALIVPYLANAWYIFLLRNYIQSIPNELFESAKIDGANDYTIFFSITVHLITPATATVGLFTALAYWNDWWLGLMLIENQKLQPLQLMLRTIVSNVMFLRTSGNAVAMSQISRTLPSEGIKMAVCVITIGPIIVLYPLLQKYFVKGIMIGAVKG